MSDRLLSPRSAARALGASESSLKRWVDAGELAVNRTLGGHRRIPVSEVLRFARRQGITLRDPALVGRPARTADRRLHAQVERLLLAGDGAALEKALLQAHLAGLPVHALGDGPLRAALAAIGEKWKHGSEGIAAEHQATMLVVRCLEVLRGVLPEPAAAAPVAVGGGPAGDPHILPSLLVSLVGQEAGWRSIDLGPNTPDDALSFAARLSKATLVWRSFSGELDAAVASADLRRLCQDVDPVPVVVGGRQLAALGDLAGVKNLIVAPTMSDLAALLRARLVQAGEGG